MAVAPKPNAKQSLEEKSAKLFEKYISDKKILVADISASSRAGLAKTIINMGAKTANITLAANFAQAKIEIERQKPHVIIAEYDLGARSGLELIQAQRLTRPDSKEMLFVLVTGNTSQSAVAQAAEEDVDTFILKPYTLDMIRNSIMRAALAKLFPSEYVKTIEEGKKLLFAGKIDEALAVFEKAIGMNEKPSLACFYHGQAELMKQSLEEAENDYSAGLEYNKIHYKCMVGLFELLMTKKAYTEAYDVVKRISRYFPANPQRLNSVLRLAVMTKSYEDIERYYQIFTSLDDRNEELIKYICAALVVCGKYYLQNSLNSRAMELFQKAMVTASGRTKILREVIVSLIAFDKAKEAQDFLKRFPPEGQNSQDYLVLEFLVNDRLNPWTLSIEHGRKLIANGIHDPMVYKVLIGRSQTGGFKDSAESLCYEACQRWPEMKADFERALRSTK